MLTIDIRYDNDVSRKMRTTSRAALRSADYFHPVLLQVQEEQAADQLSQ
jgi:hypothetical protein